MNSIDTKLSELNWILRPLRPMVLQKPLVIFFIIICKPFIINSLLFKEKIPLNKHRGLGSYGFKVGTIIPVFLMTLFIIAII